MRIIIDTNIYLNFYRLNGEQSLEMLNYLNEFIKSDRFELILPKQIKNEFIRVKNSKKAIYEDHILNFQKDLKTNPHIPLAIESFPKIRQIESSIKKLNTLADEATEFYKKNVFKSDSKINRQLDKLFTKASCREETDEVLQRAYFRTLRGNPPRKNNSSFGDAIIWETILSQYTDDDLVFISNDNDFGSEINKCKIHELLDEEWKEKTNKKLILYSTLGQFINKYKNKEESPIAGKTIKDERNLNSIFAGIPHNNVCDPSIYRTVYNDTVYLDDRRGINSAIIDTGIENSFGMLNSTIFNGCKNIQLPKHNICSKCGRHYYNNGINSTFDGKCQGCQNI